MFFKQKVHCVKVFTYAKQTQETTESALFMLVLFGVQRIFLYCLQHRRHSYKRYKLIHKLFWLLNWITKYQELTQLLPDDVEIMRLVPIILINNIIGVPVFYLQDF